MLVGRPVLFMRRDLLIALAPLAFGVGLAWLIRELQLRAYRAARSEISP